MSPARDSQFRTPVLAGQFGHAVEFRLIPNIAPLAQKLNAILRSGYLSLAERSGLWSRRAATGAPRR